MTGLINQCGRGQIILTSVGRGQIILTSVGGGEADLINQYEEEEAGEILNNTGKDRWGAPLI